MNILNLTAAVRRLDSQVGAAKLAIRSNEFTDAEIEFLRKLALKIRLDAESLFNALEPEVK